MSPCTPASDASVLLVWRRFADLTPSEAAVVTACWSGDPTPLHVRCMPGKTVFVVTSPAPLGRFHWAVFSEHGLEVDEGWEASLAEARRVAVEAQVLWSHRCTAKEKCRCAKFQR